MEKISTQRPEMRLMGITCRANNDCLFKTDVATNKIAETVQTYFHQGYPDQIPDRVRSGVTYCVYTDYESDYRGDYTYFIGEEVESFDRMPDGFVALTIPAQTYLKFTTEAGPMPNVCIDMWKKIWAMEDQELCGKRTYKVDFEVYDERAADHQNVVLDIFIGVQD